MRLYSRGRKSVISNVTLEAGVVVAGQVVLIGSVGLEGRELNVERTCRRE